MTMLAPAECSVRTQNSPVSGRRYDPWYLGTDGPLVEADFTSAMELLEVPMGSDTLVLDGGARP